MRALSPSARQATASAFADAVTGVFAFAVPLLLLAFLLSWFLREAPLRTASGEVRRSVVLEIEFGEDALIAYADPAFVPDEIGDRGGLRQPAGGSAREPR